MSGVYYLTGFLLVSGVLCSPLETRDSAPTELDFTAAETWDSLLAEMRASTIVPLLVNPFQINKLTCGSLVTFYDASTTSLTVAVDVCLVALVIAKLIVVVPYVLNRINLSPEGGVFSLLDAVSNSLEKLGDAGTGPEGEPYGLEELNQEYKETVLPAVHQAGFAGSTAGFVDSGSSFGSSAASSGGSGFVGSEPLNSDTYTGFGFSGWSSGLQKLSQLAGDETLSKLTGAQVLAELSAELSRRSGHQDEGLDEGLYDYLPRGFPTAKVEGTLLSVLRQLSKAVHIQKKD